MADEPEKVKLDLSGVITSISYGGTPSVGGMYLLCFILHYNPSLEPSVLGQKFCTVSGTFSPADCGPGLSGPQKRFRWTSG